MRNDLGEEAFPALFEERYFTLFINDEACEQFLCSEGSWGELAVGYLLSQGRMQSAADIAGIDIGGDGVYLSLRGALCPARFLTDRLDALHPFPQKAKADDQLIKGLGHILQKDAPFGRHRAVICYGDQRALFDDAGRHNACDKAIGYAALQGWPMRDCILGTSGRLSLEMLGKAACCGIPLLFTLKYPSDLCAQYAKRLELCLIARAASERPVRL